MFKPANKVTLHDNILGQLVAAIRSGKWVNGEKLPTEHAFAEQFQVSRNCIREVLKALALAQVISSRPRNGTFLTADALQRLDGSRLSSSIWGDSSLWDLKEVRKLLEGHTAYMAAIHSTEEQIVWLEDTLLHCEKNSTECHACFHKALSTIAGNKLLANLLSSVQNEMDILRNKYKKMPKLTLEAYTAEHLEIFTMIREHKPEEARQAMLEHIDNAWVDSVFINNEMF